MMKLLYLKKGSVEIYVEESSDTYWVGIEPSRRRVRAGRSFESLPKYEQEHVMEAIERASDGDPALKGEMIEAFKRALIEGPTALKARIEARAEALAEEARKAGFPRWVQDAARDYEKKEYDVGFTFEDGRWVLEGWNPTGWSSKNFRNSFGTRFPWWFRKLERCLGRRLGREHRVEVSPQDL